MANIHSHNVSRSQRMSVYSRRAGATLEPQVPWTTRRLDWLRLIAKPDPGRVAEPYAKRKAAMAELDELLPCFPPG